MVADWELNEWGNPHIRAVVAAPVVIEKQKSGSYRVFSAMGWDSYDSLEDAQEAFEALIDYLGEEPI